MRDLINSIIDRNFTEANNLLEEHLSYITVVKLEEAKKMCAAKMSVEHQSLNEDDVEEAVDPKDNSLDVEKGPAQPDKNVTVLHKTDTNKTVIHKNNLKESDDLGPVDKRKGESQEYENSKSGKKIRSTRHPGKEWKLVNEEETLEEARFRIVKARIRGGKIQRRKKISNVPGYRMQGSTLQRMSPAERRRRKMGARRAKIKRRSKINRTLMKRQRSNRRRKALGL